MSRRGHCHDNAVAENFFQLFKHERIKKKIYGTQKEAHNDVFDHLETFYNSNHQYGSNDQMPPAEYEHQYYLTARKCLVYPWRFTDQEFVDGYRAEARPLRELIIESLKTLPVEIQKMVQEHIVIGQIVGDWDFLNERFENIGISKNSDGQYRVASLDRGSSFGVGFWGKSKPEGYSGAVNQRPPAFLPLNSAFVQEKAVFGSDLAALGKDFSYMPYGDVAKLLSGKAEWLPETLKKIAYRITVANDHDLIHKILKDTLMDVSDAGLEERHFLSKAQTESILGARLRHAIEQAGGDEAVQRWAQQNTTEAARIAGEVASIRESLGYDF